MAKMTQLYLDKAFDATIQAETGYMNISGHDKRPTMIGTVFLDYTTGLNTAIGILAALHSRASSGKGELIETSLVSSALSLSMGAVPDFFLIIKILVKMVILIDFPLLPIHTKQKMDIYILWLEVMIDFMD